MKKIILHTLLVLGIAFSAPGCKKYLEGINDNPNDLTSVDPNLLLPSAEAHLSYGIGGDISRLTSMITQQCTGSDRQWLTYQVYSITETDTDNWWRFNFYGGPLKDLFDLRKIATEKGCEHYKGIANVLMAYSLLTATDLFGDIPYSEAFLGGENTKPNFDSQQDIYATVQTLLTDAKNSFALPAGPLVPGPEDAIYAGDVSQWTKFANLLSARASLHLGKMSSSNYSDALMALSAGAFSANADNATFNFGTSETEAAPWYQFNDQRGDIAFTGWLMDTMLVMADPRFDIYFDTTGGGLAMGTFFNSPNSPFDFGTYVEQKFIEAEAKFQSGDAIGAATAHNEAVLASLSRYGVQGVNIAFEAAEANENALSITLQKIMVQKYIALFTNVEVFTDWRRTGFPNIQPVPGNITGDIIPRRLPNPQSERLYNPNAPVGPAITTSVWWDI